MVKGITEMEQAFECCLSAGVSDLKKKIKVDMISYCESEEDDCVIIGQC